MCGATARRAVTVIRAAGVAARQFRARAPFDLIFANILLGPLQRLARPIRMLTARRAHAWSFPACCRDRACRAWPPTGRTGFVLLRRIELDGWVTLVLRRGVAVRRRHQ